MSYHIFGDYKTKAEATKKAKWFRDKAHFKSATVHKSGKKYVIHTKGYKL